MHSLKNYEIFCSTVKTFQVFSVIKILRKINFGEGKSSKNVILATLGALKMAKLVDLCLQKGVLGYYADHRGPRTTADQLK